MARSWVASLVLESTPGSSKFLGLQGGGSPGRNVLVGSGRVPGVVVCIVLGSGRSEECTSEGREKSTPVEGFNPGGRSGSSAVRSVPACWPSSLLSLVLGTLEPGPGLPVGQMGKVQGALGRGGGVGQLAGVFRVGDWQQGDSLTRPAVVDEGVPLAMGVKATGLWVDFGAFSRAASSSSMWRSSGLR